MSKFARCGEQLKPGGVELSFELAKRGVDFATRSDVAGSIAVECMHASVAPNRGLTPNITNSHLCSECANECEENVAVGACSETRVNGFQDKLVET
jgi:hypothetical protein